MKAINSNRGQVNEIPHYPRKNKKQAPENLT